jgi:hypothetical protein
MKNHLVLRIMERMKFLTNGLNVVNAVQPYLMPKQAQNLMFIKNGDVWMDLEDIAQWEDFRRNTWNKTSLSFLWI